MDGYEFIQKADKIKNKILTEFIDPATSVPKDYELIGNEKRYSPHFGYPSILPIAFGILDSTSK